MSAGLWREIGSSSGWSRPRLMFSSLAAFGCHRPSGTVMPHQTRESTASELGRRWARQPTARSASRPRGDARPGPARCSARRTPRRIQTPEESGPPIDRSSDHHWLSFAVLTHRNPTRRGIAITAAVWSARLRDNARPAAMRSRRRLRSRSSWTRNVAARDNDAHTERAAASGNTLNQLPDLCQGRRAAGPLSAREPASASAGPPPRDPSYRACR